MFQAVGDLSVKNMELVKNKFSSFKLDIEFRDIDNLSDLKIISFTKEATKKLIQKDLIFYNWDLLFSFLDDENEKKLEERIKILTSILSLKSKPLAQELHASIRVHNLANSARFYTWLFGIEPKEWTHRYVTFVRPDTKFNFVILVSDGQVLHHDTLYHLGMGVASKKQVLEFHHSALENSIHIEKPPRTTWKGTPLHELWLKDPDGTLIEIYARLSEKELLEMPVNKEPTFL